MGGARVVGLRAGNFLSLRDFSLELGQLTALVGPNASGKSNVVKALRALSALARGGLEALHSELGMGLKELVFKGGEGAVLLGTELELNGKPVSYEVEFSEHAFAERLRVAGRDALACCAEPLGYACSYLTASAAVERREVKRAHAKAVMGVPAPEFGLWNVPADADEDLLRARGAISSLRAYSFEPSKLRSASTIAKELTLSYDGGNLARVLFNLYLERRETFAQIEEFLRGMVPEIEQLLTSLKSEREVFVAVCERGIKMPLSYRQIADGTLRLLAFVTALHLDATLVAFEEPENCVHPHLLKTLVDMLRKAPCQVVVTTHSPYLLDHVEPEEVVVFEKVEGETRARRLSEPTEVERVRKMLEEGLTMGEIWYSGAIGGVPE